jgi:hypothetical protein
VESAPGQQLDPTRHQAIGEVEAAEQEAGTIVTVVQRGYEARGVLLRPALVQTARTAQAAPAAGTEAGEGVEAAGTEVGAAQEAGATESEAP